MTLTAQSTAVSPEQKDSQQTSSTIFCPVMRVEINEEDKGHFEEYASKNHAAVVCIMRSLMALRGKPYWERINKNDEPVLRTQEEIDKQRAALAPNKKHWPQLADFIENVVFKDSTEKYCSPLLFANYTPDETNRKHPVRQLCKKILEDELGFSEFEEMILEKEKKGKKRELKSTPKKYFTREEWETNYHAVIAGYDIDTIVEQAVKNCPDSEKYLAVKFREAGIFPLPLPLELDNPLLKAAYSEAISKLSGWCENNKLYQELRSEQKKKIDKLEEEMTPQDVDLFAQFVAECKQANFGLTPKFIKHYDPHVPSEDSPVRVGMKILFQEKYDALRRMDGDESVLLRHLEHHCKLNKHEGKRASACITFPTKENCLLRMGLTSRGRKFTLSANHSPNDNKGNYINFTLKGLDSQEIKGRALPTKYLLNPKIKPVRKEKPSTIIGYEISYIKGVADRPTVHGVIKELRFAYPKGVPHLYASINVQVDKNPEGIIARKYFSSSIGNNDELVEKIPLGMRFAFIDINYNPFIAATIWEIAKKKKDANSIAVDGIGWANLVHSQLIGTGKNERLKSLEKKLDCLKKYIGFSKAIRDGLELSKYQLEKYKEWEEELGISIDAKLINSKEPLGQQDAYAIKDMIGQSVKELRQEYRKLIAKHALRDNPKYKGDDIVSSETLSALFATEMLIRVVKSWARYEHKCGQNKFGFKQTENECAALYRYMNNAKLDLRRKAVHVVEKLCHQHNVKVLVAENLNLQQSLSQNKRENVALRIWTPNSFKENLERIESRSGIAVQFINGNFSSQICFLTNEFANRPKGYDSLPIDSRKLYFMINGKSYIGHNDLMASAMLAKFFFTRHDTIFQLKARRIKDEHKKDVLKGSETKDCDSVYLIVSDGKYALSFLKRNLGSEHAILVANMDNDGNMVGHLEKITKRHATKFATFVRGKYLPFMRHGKKWFEQEAHWGKLKNQASKIDQKNLRVFDIETITENKLPAKKLYGKSLIDNN
jgi:IS605 OrfB family transposase